MTASFNILENMGTTGIRAVSLVFHLGFAHPSDAFSVAVQHIPVKAIPTAYSS